MYEIKKFNQHMDEIKKFNQYSEENSESKSTGQRKVLSIDDNKIKLSIGEFKLSEEVKKKFNLKEGYTYTFITKGQEVVDVQMRCVDILIFVKEGESFEVLSIKRGHPPFVGMWANPGGNIDEGESPIDAAFRELEEETTINISENTSNLLSVKKFDKPWRDPRIETCVTYPFTFLINDKPKVVASDDATDYQWNKVNSDGSVDVDMAFDHEEIIKEAFKSISKLSNTKSY